MGEPTYPYLERLRTAANSQGAEYRGTLEALIDGAQKYEWLLKHFPEQITMLGWSVPDACKDEVNRSDLPTVRAQAVMSVAVKQMPRGVVSAD
jgi:hypothetical protein